jgi:methylated-DNA-[protein]-cysteine S-methyltransferase
MGDTHETGTPERSTGGMNEHTLYTQMNSPIGELLLFGNEHGLRGLYMGGKPDPAWQRDDAVFANTVTQLDEYFTGARTEFDLELDMRGTDFQKKVWEALLTIPYGETRSYGEIARQIGRPDRARAVGAANGQNPIAVIVPCHRVIGADGSLVGYGGGLERKRLLLDLESGVQTLTA